MLAHLLVPIFLLNYLRRQRPGNAVIRSKSPLWGRVAVGAVALPLLLALPAFTGCGPSAAPPVDGRLAIENVAKWRQLYCADHGGKPPADEKAFVDFVQKKLSARGEPFNPDEMLVSPRDGQRFVVLYGDQSAKLSEGSVAVYEKEGYGGKVLIALESARSREVDAAELPGLLAAKP